MERKTTHQEIIVFHEEIAQRHKNINGFYRFDLNEIEGEFRKGVGTPALLLLSHSSVLSSNTNKVANFNTRTISFLIIDHVPKMNDFAKQNEILNNTEGIALDIISYCVRSHKTEDSFLYNLFDIDTVRIEKVGPIFGNMYGWNIIYDIKNREPMCWDESKWS